MSLDFGPQDVVGENVPLEDELRSAGWWLRIRPSIIALSIWAACLGEAPFAIAFAACALNTRFWFGGMVMG